MKLERLALTRYGHFTDEEIAFGGHGVRLHVVLGVNEAGKTTALRAVGDLLFGIDVRSPFDFRHDYKSMRIGATLRGSDGRALAVWRRKGNRNTLLDSDGRPLGDDALAPFLGGADRVVFDRLFGLTHESLREGGNEMLAGQGDLGRMLFEAGNSMRSVTKVLDALESEAGALFTTRRLPSKAFWAADAARVTAERELRQATLTVDCWRQSERDLERAEAARNDVRRRRCELEARRAGLHRISRVRSRLEELRQIEAHLTRLADVPILPDDAGARLAEARTAYDVACSRLEREHATAAAARESLAELEIPAALLAVGDEVTRLYDWRAAILANRDEAPRLQARRDELDDSLRRARADLEGGDMQPPGEAALSEVRALIERDGELTRKTDDVRERRDLARAELQVAEAALAAAPRPPDLTRLGMAVDHAQRSGDLDGDLTRIERVAAEADRALAVALSSLRLWTGNASELVGLAVCERETVQRFERDMLAAQTAATRMHDALETERERLHACERDLSAIAAGGGLPTEAAVAVARRHRDQGWRLIRRLCFDREPLSDEEIEAFAPRARLAERFELAVDQADAIADLRQAESERLARHAQAQADCSHHRRRCSELEDAVRQADAALVALHDDWRGLWQAVGIAPEPPREMDRWLDRREDVLRALDEAGAARQSLTAVHDRLARERADLCAALEHAGAHPGAGVSFTALVREARQRLDDGRNEQSARAVLEAKRKAQTTALRYEQARLDGLAEHRADWRQAWSVVMARVGLGAETPCAAAKAALDRWERIRGYEEARVDVARRLAGIERESTAFAAEVHDLVAAALPALKGCDPLVGAAEAFQRLQAALRDVERKRDLEGALREAEGRGSSARADVETARATLDDLRRLANCADDDALTEAIARSQRKVARTKALEELQRWIIQQSEGMGLEQAIREAAGYDPHAVEEEIARISDDLDALSAQQDGLSESIADLRRRCAEMEAGSGAAAAEQARRNALADATDCAERWMVARAAAFLLRRGIDQFRQEQQGPLLARAQQLFSTLTLGSFTHFQIDYDLTDTPRLLGVRAGGATCPVDGMSDGTRDQLFLALRLAALERYLDAAEPLPFIADDLFVHFDDARTLAGLEALVELGARTQVLLFTHHRRLAELARRIGKPGQVRVQALDLRTRENVGATNADCSASAAE